MKFRSFIITIFLSHISLSAFTQNDSAFLVNAGRSLTNHIDKSSVEKVYLHLDRPYYLPGDTIWFKAYTVVGEQHQLSALSGVLYCELINTKDSVINRRILKLMTGMAWADFSLPRSLKQGSYRIRAYTNWMRNAGAEYFYNQAIHVGGVQPSLQLPNGITKLKPDIQFFPEGGELVNGMRSRVAVKSVSPNGLGEDVRGVISDNDGNQVADFTTQHLGMGVFALVPQAGKTYKANIICTDSSKLTLDLPKAQEEGYTLTINNNDLDSIYVKVAANDKLFQAKQNSAFYLAAQSGGKLYYTAQSRLAAPVFTTRIPKDRFPSGIVQFTLFSQNGEPVNERIIFVKNENDAIQVKLSSAAQTYAPRQKVEIDIDTKNGGNPPITGSYSVSVINESRIPVDENSESTIFNNLLLTSDLKGYIEQPNYYFNHVNDQTRLDLDVLMLTQGYRRFEWKQVLTHSTPAITYQPEKSLELEGSLKTPNGKAIPNGKVTFVASRQNFLADTVTDINGNFKFTNIDLPDTARAILRARKEHNGSNVTIYVKQKDFPSVIRQKEIMPEWSPVLTVAMQKNLADYQKQMKEDSLKNGKQLKEVVIKDKNVPPPDIYNNYGTRMEYNVDMKRLAKEFISIKEALIYVIPGLAYNRGQFFYEHKKVGHFIIDGMERTADDVDYFSPKEVESIRMISPTFLDSSELVLSTRHYAGTDTLKTVTLKTVDIKANKVRKEPELTHSDNLNGPGHADQVVMGDKLEGCVKLSDCLTGKLFGVMFTRDGVPSTVRSQGRLTGAIAMAVIVDGMILDGDHLNDLNANDIYSIEVLRSGAYLAVYGSNAPGGALVITTKRGGESYGDNKYVTSESPSGLIVYPFKGYSMSRKFYSPKYDSPKTDSQPLDLRSTIYWNPLIITDKDGKASFEYYNADTKGTYRVVIEGIDDNGNLGRQVYRYKVE